MLAEFAVLVDRLLQFHSLDAQAPFAGLLRVDQLLQRRELRPQIEIMDECVFLVTYVDECRVEPRHDFTHLAEVDVPHGETRLALFLRKFGQHLVFAQGDGYFSRVDVYD